MRGRTEKKPGQMRRVCLLFVLVFCLIIGLAEPAAAMEPTKETTYEPTKEMTEETPEETTEEAPEETTEETPEKTTKETPEKTTKETPEETTEETPEETTEETPEETTEETPEETTEETPEETTEEMPEETTEETSEETTKEIKEKITDETIEEITDETTIRVLLVGNSYTYRNDLAGMIEKIGESRNVRLIVGTLARQKASLSDYANKKSKLGKRFRQALKNGNWDYVVLQDRRFRPIKNANGMKKDAEKLCRLIRNAGAQPMLYMTWAPSKGHKDYRTLRSRVSGRKSYQKKVTAVYKKIGKSTGAQVIPAGLALNLAEETFPDLKFKASDRHHPNKNGSYVVACTIYSVLTGESAYGEGTYTAGISTDTAMQLQSIAWKYASEYLR